jgi:Ethanolamine utilization protein EutJ (predicted chaperonin)
MTNPIHQLGQLINQPDSWNFAGARRFYAGIDLGTYKTIAIIIDETGMPRAASMRKCANTVRWLLNRAPLLFHPRPNTPI